MAFDHTFGKGFDVSTHVFFDSYTYGGIYPYNYSPETGSTVTLNYDYSDGKWWGEDVKVSRQLFSNNKLVFGNEFRDNFRETQGNYDIEPSYALYLNDHHSSNLWAAYVQDEYVIRSDLRLNAGIRYDHYSTFGGTTNPRVGLIYNPFEKTTFKLLYGTAFRAPNAFELYYILPDYSSQNPSLGPESIRSAEFVVEQYIGDRYRLSASVFQNRIKGLIDQVPLSNGLLQYQNLGSVRAQGTEITFARKWSSGLAAQCNYTYEHAIETELGTRSELDNVPANLLNLNVLVPFLPKRPTDLTLGIDLHYVSAARTLSGSHAPQFVLMNATLFARRLFKGLTLSGSVYNLLDSHYGYPGGIEHPEDILYQNGRSARLKLVYTIGGGSE
jgi:iron complex outermembrane receptor protein